MAKKPLNDEEEEDDFDEDLFGDDVTDEYPSLDNESSGTAESSAYSPEEYDEEEEDSLEFEFEEPEVKKDYKYLKLDIKKGLNEGDHVISIEGQSHGFCNLFVKHLLSIDGVISSAYRITVIEPPEIFIRLHDGYKVQDVLFKAIESLRKDLSSVEKMFQKLM